MPQLWRRQWLSLSSAGCGCVALLIFDLCLLTFDLLFDYPVPLDLLHETEVRVLACLIEKESTTPEYYPLSLNALMQACNQKTNRDPVVSHDEDTVSGALDSLRAKQLARLSSAQSRVAKYEHSILEVFNL